MNALKSFWITAIAANEYLNVVVHVQHKNSNYIDHRFL